jgi:hypothetical protein
MTTTLETDHRPILGPHRVPHIECGKCGTKHHIDAASGEYQGHCRECFGFLRRPTEAEEQAFYRFMEWKMKHMEAGR